jgi:hypothetical protein
MSKAAILLWFASAALFGCDAGGPEPRAETISVAAELARSASYNIDLTREDAVYIVEAGLDGSRLSVTCPTLSVLTFSDYVTRRIRPTGSTYDPATLDLVVANGEVPAELLNPPTGAFAAECKEVCVDRADGSESCIVLCNDF